MNPRIKKVIALENYQIKLTFDNGEVRVFNVTPYLEQGFFKELKEKNYFKRVNLLLGSISWPHGQDFCPDTLYEESVPEDSKA